MESYSAICGDITLFVFALMHCTFTNVLQVNIFLACSDETHTNVTLLHMSGFAVHYSLSTGKRHSSGAALSFVPTAFMPILARLVIFPCIHTHCVCRDCVWSIPLSLTLGLSLSTSSPSSVNIQMSHDKEGHHNHYLHNGPFIITGTSFSEY